VELVDGTGLLRTISATADPELFWAVRGGGGDFGIVTRIEVDLHPAPQVYGGRLLWPADLTRDVLRAFAEVTRSAPRELTVWFHAYQFPPFPEVPEPLRGRAFASVAVAHLGSPEEAEALLAPFRALPEPVLDLMGDVPLPALGSIADEPTDPTPALERSWLLDRLDDTLLDRVAAVLEAGTPLAALQLRHLGGAFTDVAPGQGSHGPVPEPYSLFALGIPAVPELVGPLQATFERIGDTVAEHTSGRALLNFLGAHGDPGRWWSEGTRARLVRAKAAADPADVIRSNRPVTPTTAAR
jgi:hypothetical protein